MVLGRLGLASRLIPQASQDTAVLRGFVRPFSPTRFVIVWYLGGGVRLVHHIVFTHERFPSFVQEISFPCTFFLCMLSVLIFRGLLRMLILISFPMPSFHLGTLYELVLELLIRVVSAGQLVAVDKLLLLLRTLLLMLLLWLLLGLMT